ncbi:uncharacterized protein GGS22DRAFT_129561 [Annulohypoxylon maeteangense]|uniref:uncharacterized protein n=1 Tax=Annulohypoxylon maeteangense TaxID=1927788 RepID=UPI002007D4EF|nr:uncharacterized protein GGS22DRAFT_129561 [Annulohypoxylon maeteangense]KAI0885473.1 hypothetical protein GGS22DRAFT_129561 [Annulohypoxylon maeteangense]
MKLYTARQLTISLHEHTADIFSSLVVLLEELLNCARSKISLTDKQKHTLEILVKSFNNFIDKTDDVARRTNNSTLHDGYSLRNRDQKLDILHHFVGLLEPRASRCQDVSDEVGTGVEEYQHKLDRLTRYLAYDGDQTMKDIQKLALPQDIESYHMDRLTGLTKQPEFQSWLQEDKMSTRLLIQGNFETSGINSPLSHLCARFPNEYLRRGQTGIIFLHYFCRIQLSRRGMMANACDIASNLIGQLIHNSQLASHIRIGYLKPMRMKKIKKQNFKQTIQLFFEILSQISDESLVIFCFIDSISAYESSNKLRETLEFFERLCNFLEPRSSRKRKGETRTNIIFKLLVTEARRTSHVYKYFKRPGETLNMHE